MRSDGPDAPAHRSPGLFRGISAALRRNRNPAVEARIRRGLPEIVGLDENDSLSSSVAEVLERVVGTDHGLSVNFTAMPPRHVGLGTGTAACLAAATGAAHLLGLEHSHNRIALDSERGGTSGIGVNCFSVGGVVFDGGRIVAANEPFSPSRYSKPDRHPPVISRLELSSRWRVTLCIPPGSAPHGEDELDFFTRQMPLPADESLKSIALAYHGVAPAILEEDLRALGAAIRELHLIGFKKREVERQDHSTQSLLRDLQNRREMAAGMSSLGPLVYTITEVDDGHSLEYIRSRAESAGARVVEAVPSLTGRRIES